MIFSTLIADQSSPETAFAIERQTLPRQKPNLVIPGPDSCRSQIDLVVREIACPAVREIIGVVFQDLLRLLECLSLIEIHLRQIDLAEETFALFQIINDEACALVKFIREDALPCEAMNEQLSDTLDGIAFAVNHDLRRVFKADQSIAIEEKNDQVVVGKLFRDHDVLTNCLQQSTISLALLFDPELEGVKLFNNSDMRYRQSVQLCEDLSTLLQLVDACGGIPLEPAFANLAAGLEKFRSESMEYLLYSDWPQFEICCERIQLAATSAELQSQLHQFRCYVETLLGQVRMRAVLANAFPIRFGANDIILCPTANAEHGMKFSASSDLRDENANWETLSLAG